MGGGLESRCVSRVYGADGAVHHPHRKHILFHDIKWLFESDKIYLSTATACLRCNQLRVHAKSYFVNNNNQ